MSPRFAADARAANMALVDLLKQIAERKQATPAQIALAWLGHQSQVFGLAVVPIPGTRKPSRVEQNVGGAMLALTTAELAALEPLANAVSGDRGRSI